MRLPIVAYASDTSAVGEVMGANQLVYDRVDYETLAAAINVLHSDEGASNYLVAEGYENFMKYERSILEEKLVSYLGELR